MADIDRSFDEDPEDPAVLKREIERLRNTLRIERECNSHQGEIDAQQRHLIKELRTRIEELEEALKETLNNRQEITDLVLAGEHIEIITRKRIDAVWKYVDEELGCIDNDYESFTLALLNELGIERCEECRGTGDVGLNDCAVGCPDCNGRGWAKK